MTGGVCVGSGVHGTLDYLGDNTALRHTVYGCDLWLFKVGPQGHITKKRVAQINKYFLSHYKYLQILK